MIEQIRKKIKKMLKPPPCVAVVRLNGIIGATSSYRHGNTLFSLEKEIDRAFRMKNLKAVALIVNSPGGSPAQSFLIYNYLRKKALEEKKPLITFAEDVAASGGYFILMSGSEVYALEASIIGSIGVISSGFGFHEMIKKIGIERRVYTEGENKSILDPFLPEKEKDVKILREIQKDIFENFKKNVKEARKGKLKGVEKEIFSGAFWTGSTAQKLGLVDEIGDLHSVIKEKFGKKIEIKYIEKPKGFLEKKLDFFAGIFIRKTLTAIEEKTISSKFGM